MYGSGLCEIILANWQLRRCLFSCHAWNQLPNGFKMSRSNILLLGTVLRSEVGSKPRAWNGTFISSVLSWMNWSFSSFHNLLQLLNRDIGIMLVSVHCPSRARLKALPSSVVLAWIRTIGCHQAYAAYMYKLPFILRKLTTKPIRDQNNVVNNLMLGQLQKTVPTPNHAIWYILIAIHMDLEQISRCFFFRSLTHITYKPQGLRSFSDY